MLRIMAQENSEEWGGTAQTDIETIRSVRQYLMDHWDVTGIPMNVRKMMKDTPRDKWVFKLLTSSLLDQGRQGLAGSSAATSDFKDDIIAMWADRGVTN